MTDICNVTFNDTQNSVALFFLFWPYFIQYGKYIFRTTVSKSVWNKKMSGNELKTLKMLSL